MEDEDGIKKVADLMNGAHLCTLSTYDGDNIISRPMGLQQVEFDGDLWFFTYQDSHKVREIKAYPHVNLSFENSGSWVSLSGTATIVQDTEKAEELWNPFLKAWFPEGVETKGLTLLKVNAESAEYWDAQFPKAIQLLGMVKAAVTGTPAKGADNETVTFDQNNQ